MLANHNKLQFDEHGNIRHFLSLESFSDKDLLDILNLAKTYLNKNNSVKKVNVLKGKTIMNIFFEPSTRTRTTFEIAEKKLSADVINLDVENSATNKGESLVDTLYNLDAMHADMFVIRHNASGASHFFAKQIGHRVRVLNAGDGSFSHPTQAMLDMFTIMQEKGEIYGLNVAIIGDILHSRVCRSQIQALSILGAREIRVVAPETLIPPDLESLGVHYCDNLNAGLADADVVIMLRLQKERMVAGLVPSYKEYFNNFGLTRERLKYAKPDAILMHPGPINRGVEIDSSVAYSKQSVILKQVTNGIAVRMAIMAKMF